MFFHPFPKHTAHCVRNTSRFIPVPAARAKQSTSHRSPPADTRTRHKTGPSKPRQPQLGDAAHRILVSEGVRWRARNACPRVISPASRHLDSPSPAPSSTPTAPRTRPARPGWMGAATCSDPGDQASDSADRPRCSVVEPLSSWHTRAPGSDASGEGPCLVTISSMSAKRDRFRATPISSSKSFATGTRRTRRRPHPRFATPLRVAGGGARPEPSHDRATPGPHPGEDHRPVRRCRPRHRQGVILAGWRQHRTGARISRAIDEGIQLGSAWRHPTPRPQRPPTRRWPGALPEPRRLPIPAESIANCPPFAFVYDTRPDPEDTPTTMPTTISQRVPLQHVGPDVTMDCPYP